MNTKLPNFGGTSASGNDSKYFQTFVTGRTRSVPTLGGGGRDDDDDEGGDGSGMTSDMMIAGSEGAQGSAPAPPPPAAIDLLGGLMDDEPVAAPPPPAAGGMGGMGGMGGLDDIFGGPAAPAAPPPSALKVTLDSAKGEGIQIRSAFVKENGQLMMRLTVENGTQMPLSGFAIQFNKNSFGLNSESPAAIASCLPQQIMPGQSGSGAFNLLTSGQLSDSKGAVQMAIKTNVKVFYFQDFADVLLFLTPDGRLEQKVWLEQWKAGLQEHRIEVSGIPQQSEVVEAICPKLEASSVFFIARRKLAEGDFVYLSCKSFNGIVMLAEIGFHPGTGNASIVVKSAQPQYLSLLATSLDKLLKA